MDNIQTENIFGALSLTLADGLLSAAQSVVPSSEPASAIALIGHAPNLTINQASSVLGLSHPATVRLIDRLSSDGLVTRTRSPNDARAVCLALTEKGRLLHTAILEARQVVLSKAFSGITATERKILARISEKMFRSIIEDAEHARKSCRLCDENVCANCPLEDELSSRRV